MQPTVAETAPRRVHAVWLGAAFAAGVVAFALTRPPPPPHVPARPIVGHCGEHRHRAPLPPPEARTGVPSYYVYY
jgi:hypothetical protein